MFGEIFAGVKLVGLNEFAQIPSDVWNRADDFEFTLNGNINDPFNSWIT